MRYENVKLKNQTNYIEDIEKGNTSNDEFLQTGLTSSTAEKKIRDVRDNNQRTNRPATRIFCQGKTYSYQKLEIDKEQKKQKSGLQR